MSTRDPDHDAKEQTFSLYQLFNELADKREIYLSEARFRDNILAFFKLTPELLPMQAVRPGLEHRARFVVNP